MHGIFQNKAANSALKYFTSLNDCSMMVVTMKVNLLDQGIKVKIKEKRK